VFGIIEEEEEDREENLAERGWTTSKNGVSASWRMTVRSMERSCYGGIGHQRAQAHGMKKKKNIPSYLRTLMDVT